MIFNCCQTYLGCLLAWRDLRGLPELARCLRAGLEEGGQGLKEMEAWRREVREMEANKTVR